MTIAGTLIIFARQTAINRKVLPRPGQRGGMEATIPQGVSEQESLDLFPFGAIRAGQDRFLDDARSCLRQGINLIAHAPTGLGKTAVSLAAGLEACRLDDGHLMFTTARQSQHNAAIETLRLIWRSRPIGAVDIIAKEDMCLARRKSGLVPCSEGGDCYFLNKRIEEAAQRILEYPLHVQEATRLCLRLGTCPYASSLRAAERAEVVVCDYNPVFSDGAASLMRRATRKRKSIVIVDEAHNLPQRLMDDHSGMLVASDLERPMALRSMGGHREDMRLLADIVRKLAAGKPRFHLDSGELDDELKGRCGVDCAGLAMELEDASKEGDGKRLRPLLRFLRSWSVFGNSSVRYSNEGKLICKLIEPSLVSKRSFGEIRCALLMSGTLHPPEMYADLLGISDDSVCREYSNPFPQENRPIFCVRGISSRFRDRCESNYSSMAAQIGRACQSVPGNLAVFFPSYDFMHATLFHLKDGGNKRMLVESKGQTKQEKEAMIADMRQDRNAALMATIGGSFAEGIDFSENLLSAVVVSGFPLNPPSPESERMEVRLAARFGDQRSKLYVQTYPAIAKVLQAAGRAIRSETDRAAIVLLDERYLLPSISSALPVDFHANETSDLSESLRSFFSADSRRTV
jgi:DNA excision repair protein ERCC-2